ncbi:carbohydrate kinase family protein [Arthrobacter sp. 4R501]|uniref:carbohydrate kinase family protein n=1 Tax=Arthrobacter sp. 4R501 TaxID=2058886 RepID=UPI0015E30309|nr:carbohydrate kinase family protein [Arthrobacter sp. 4R501]
MTDGITIIGNTNIDVVVADTRDLPEPGTERVVSSVSLRLGGSAGNFAVRCAGLDFPTTLVSRVGDDTSVMVLEAELRLPSLQARLLRTPGEPSGITIAVEAPGRDRAFISSLGAMASMTPDDITEDMLSSRYVALAGYFLLPGMRGPASAELFGRAGLSGARTVLDTGWPPEGWTPATRQEVLSTLALVDIFLPNDDELHGLMDDGNTERAARRLSVTTNTLVAVKMGARGAGLASPDGGWSAQPAARVDVVDSTGAGDGFNAAFLVSAARGAGWPDALASGVRYATEMVATAPERRAAVVLPTATLS